MGVDEGWVLVCWACFIVGQVGGGSLLTYGSERWLKTARIMLSFSDLRDRRWWLVDDDRFRNLVAQRDGGSREDIGRVQSHFLDSGAFTLKTKATEYAQENGCSQWDYYETKEHWQYVDDYAAFVKEYQAAIDLYANVDVIPNPELTWRNQQYLEEKHGLSPVPVVHFPTGLKWLRHYLDRGYELIGLGGLVGRTGQDGCRDWLDRVFGLVCNTPDRMPRAKLHGFGVTSHKLLIRYPWWSVDSVAWAKVGGFGNILVPRRKRKGKFDFSVPPYVVGMSVKSSKQKEADAHYLTMRRGEQEYVRSWLSEIGVPLGKVEEGEVIEEGVMTTHTFRRMACLLFFERLREWLPEWPWAYNVRECPGFGLRWGN